MKIQMWIFKLLPFFLIYFGCIAADAPEVQTALGKIKGSYKTALRGKRYCSFEGIPYAQPPTDKLRFEKAEPIDPWSGILEATKTTACLQIQMTGEFMGTEDCLHLNVYVPCENEIDPKQKYDVIVYIHGGGFMFGQGHSLNAEYMMDKDWIVVSFNYRLGVMGFISMEDDVLPGNNGLKDQVQALTWVHNYISDFGGNPDSVTLVGISAGGASTHLHYLSPLSKGLFKRGISHGGSSLMPFVLKENAKENAKKTATLVGCPDDSSGALKECLKTVPSETLIKNYLHFYGYSILPMAPYSPVVENSANSFLPEHPYLTLKQKKMADLPWIASTTTNEGVILTGVLYGSIDEIDKNWLDLAPYILECNETLPESIKEEVYLKIKDYYSGSGGHFSQNSFDKFTEMFSDRNINEPVELAAKMQAKSSSSPVYYYLFGYSGNNNLANLIYPNVPSKGVCHNEDAVYCYGFLAVKEFSETDYKMWQAFQDMLFKYASTGEVAFPGVDKWEPIKGSNFNYLRIFGPSDIKQETVDELCPATFWESLGFLENKNLF